MKLRFWDRVLAALYVLLSLALCVCVVLRSLGFDVIGAFLRDLQQITDYWYLIYYGCLLIVVLLGVYLLRLVFARKPRRARFVTVDAGDNGRVVISMEALDQMVRQAAMSAEGVSDMKIGVDGHEDSISVRTELTVLGGVHLPTVTMNLQRDIRRYVEVNCGVAVRDVTVTVGAVLPPEGGAPAAPAVKAWGAPAAAPAAAEEPAAPRPEAEPPAAPVEPAAEVPAPEFDAEAEVHTPHLTLDFEAPEAAAAETVPEEPEEAAAEEAPYAAEEAADADPEGPDRTDA